MIESAAYYDLIKQEGVQQGIQMGIQQGVQQGQLTASKEALIDLLMERFDIVPQHLLETINRMKNLFILKAISIEVFKQDLEKMIQ